MNSFNLTTAAPQQSRKRLATLAALLFGVVGLAALTSFSAQPSGMQSLFQSADDDTMVAYVNFLAEYGRSYASKKHVNDKYEVFRKNYAQIKEHNKNVKSTPFVMSVNQFADMTPQEFADLQRVEIPHVLVKETAHRHVVIEKPKHVHSASHGHGRLESKQIPESVNWFEKGAVSEPKDQM